MKQVLVTAPVHPVLLQGLQESGTQVIYEPQLDKAGLENRVADNITGLVVTTRLPIDKTVLDKATHLRWVGRLGSGMELIDAAYAQSKGIALFSTPEGNSPAVAEHALGLLLAVFRNLVKGHNEVAVGQWLRDQNRGSELSGKTVGIIGYGHTGSAFARLLQPFQVQVLAVDKYKTGFDHAYVQQVTLEQLQAQAQVVSLHLPLTPETKHYADESFFSSLQQQPLFISTCRGGVTHTAALINALQQQKISGAALDVLENEKLATLTEMEKAQLQFLTTQPNVVVTPHIAGYSHESYYRMAQVLLQKLQAAGLL